LISHGARRRDVVTPVLFGGPDDGSRLSLEIRLRVCARDDRGARRAAAVRHLTADVTLNETAFQGCFDVTTNSACWRAPWPNQQLPPAAGSVTL